MARALVIGGTRFIGRFTVEQLLENDYEVDIFNRGNHPNVFADESNVRHIEGDRTDKSALTNAASISEPDIVIDCVGYQPAEIETATRIFSDVPAYVFVSSTAAYAPGMPGLGRPPGKAGVLKREDVTPLCDCTEEQAVDDSPETYGARKAECDRRVFNAAKEGVNAIVARPCLVYGPYDYTDRHNYWIKQIDNHDRIVVPGDGSKFVHRTYVEDVARALRIIAEKGIPGEAYNIGHRQVLTVDRLFELFAQELNTSIDIIHADDNQLDEAGLSIQDFPLFRRYPYAVTTEKLSSLGWDDTPIPETIPQTVENGLSSDLTESTATPSRESIETVIDRL